MEIKKLRKEGRKIGFLEENIYKAIEWLKEEIHKIINKIQLSSVHGIFTIQEMNCVKDVKGEAG